MIGVKSKLEKLEAAVERKRADLSRVKQARAEHQASRPRGDDADAIVAWKRADRDHEDREEAEREALAFAEAAAAEARAEAEARAKDAEHKTIEREAEKGVALYEKAMSLLAQGADLLGEVETIRKAVDAANAVRGDRARIIDPEERLRPPVEVRVRPAGTTNVYAWVNNGGERVSPQVMNSEGEWIWNKEVVGKEWIEEEVYPESTETLPRPDRPSAKIRLFDLHGRQIWPPC